MNRRKGDKWLLININSDYFRISCSVPQTSGTLQPTCISTVLQTFPQAALHGGRITDDVTTEVPSLRTTILPALKDAAMSQKISSDSSLDGLILYFILSLCFPAHSRSVVETLNALISTTQYVHRIDVSYLQDILQYSTLIWTPRGSEACVSKTGII